MCFPSRCGVLMIFAILALLHVDTILGELLFAKACLKYHMLASP